MTRRPLVLILILLTATAGCAGSGSRSDPFARAGRGPGGERLSLEVINRSYSEATIYALGTVGRDRLGLVPSTTTRDYSIDWSGGAQELRAEIDLVGGNRFVTAPITAYPGDRITLVVERQLRNSYLRRGGAPNPPSPASPRIPGPG